MDNDDTKNYLSKEVWMSPPLKRITRMVFEHHSNLWSACAPNHPGTIPENTGSMQITQLDCLPPPKNLLKNGANGI